MSARDEIITAMYMCMYSEPEARQLLDQFVAEHCQETGYVMRDGCRLNRSAAEQLVQQDIEWLLINAPPSLERDHVELLLRAAVDLIYSPLGQLCADKHELAAQVRGWERAVESLKSRRV